MTIEKAIEVLEATPLFRMEQNNKDRSELGEAMLMGIQALKEKKAAEELMDDMK